MVRRAERGATGVKLDEMTRAMLAEAVRIYLEEAYGEAPAPAEVRKRLEWGEGGSLEALASGEAFERTPTDAPPLECMHIRLRLGNRQYPHMKLSADRVPGSDDWVLTVDCHDRHIVGSAPEEQRAALEAMFRENAALKGRIERRWTQAGLPTFENFIRGRLGERGR
ncbi:MAG: hypothetical protein WBD63_10280 [Phycisphaerae bacterium]|nr:hypothetical protein [Phycisphaerae bacterium]